MSGSRGKTKNRRLLPAAAAIVWAGACRQLLGLDLEVAAPAAADASTDVDAASTPRAKEAGCAGGSPCQDCVLRDCAAELATCGQDSACTSWLGCVATCPDGDTSCLDLADGSSDALGGLLGCALDTCSASCDLGALGLALGSSCTASALESCRGNWRDVWADANARSDLFCLARADCLGEGHARPDCSAACGDDNGRYAPPRTLALFGVCLYQRASGCGLSDLSCSPHFEWERAQGDTVKVTLYLTDGVAPETAGVPQVGLPVSACVHLISCTNTGSGQTDATGRVVFELPTNGKGAFAPEWDFEVTTGWPEGPSLLRYDPGRPLARDTTITLPLLNDTLEHVADPAGDPFGVPWDRSKSAVHVLPRDCLSSVVPLTIRVLGTDGTERGTVLYPQHGDVTRTGAPEGPAFVFGLDPGRYTVQGWQGETLVAEASARTVANSVTVLPWLNPLGQSQ